MLTKIVNGVPVVCSPEEEAALVAEWTANDPSKKPVPQKATAADAILGDPAALAKLKAALA